MTGSNSISATVDDIRVGELGSGTVDLYTAIGELEVGAARGTAAWLDARSSAVRVHNYLAGPDAPAQSDRTVKVRARLASPGSRDGQRPCLSPPVPSSPLP